MTVLGAEVATHPGAPPGRDGWTRHNPPAEVPGAGARSAGRRRRLGATALGLLLLGTACTWVSLEPAAERVRILRESEVSECERVGTVTAQTASQVLVFGRSEPRIDEELRALARNQAAEMGADAIVPSGPRTGGSQSFDAYRCQRP